MVNDARDINLRSSNVPGSAYSPAAASFAVARLNPPAFTYPTHLSVERTSRVTLSLSSMLSVAEVHEAEVLHQLAQLARELSYFLRSNLVPASASR